MCGWSWVLVRTGAGLVDSRSDVRGGGKKAVGDKY